MTAPLPLVLAADAAYPFNYSILPAEVRVILGYVAGNTPHIWTAQEIAAARATGREWWAIATFPERALTAADGHALAAAMVPALTARNYPKTSPVFADCEHSAYIADPAGALAARAAWSSDMHAAGWPRAFDYLPLAAGLDWEAHWGVTRPTTLPPGVVGIQYQNAVANDAYDLSVFDPSLLSPESSTVTQPTTLTAQETAQIAAVVHDQNVAVNLRSSEVHAMVHTYAQQAVHDAITTDTAVQAELAKLAAGAAPVIDYGKLAAAVAPQLASAVAAAVAPQIAQSVVVQLGTALAKGVAA